MTRKETNRKGNLASPDPLPPQVSRRQDRLTAKQRQAIKMRKFKERVEAEFLEMKTRISEAKRAGVEDASTIIDESDDLSFLLFARARLDETRGDFPFFYPESDGEVLQHEHLNGRIFVDLARKVHVKNITSYGTTEDTVTTNDTPTMEEEARIEDLAANLLLEGWALPPDFRQVALQTLRTPVAELQRMVEQHEDTVNANSTTNPPLAIPVAVPITSGVVDASNNNGGARANAGYSVNPHHFHKHKRTDQTATMSERPRLAGNRATAPATSEQLSSTASPSDDGRLPPSPLPAVRDSDYESSSSDESPVNSTMPSSDLRTSFQPPVIPSAMASTTPPNTAPSRLRWGTAQTVATMRDSNKRKRSEESTGTSQLESRADTESDNDLDSEPLYEHAKRRRLATVETDTNELAAVGPSSQMKSSATLKSAGIRRSQRLSSTKKASSPNEPPSPKTQQTFKKLTLSKKANPSTKAGKAASGAPLIPQSPAAATSANKNKSYRPPPPGQFRDSKLNVNGPDFQVIGKIPKFEANGVDQSDKLILKAYEKDRRGVYKYREHVYKPRTDKMRVIDWSNKEHIRLLNRWPMQLANRKGADLARPDMRDKWWALEEDAYLRELAETHKDDTECTRGKLYKLFNERFGDHDNEVSFKNGSRVTRRLKRTTHAFTSHIEREHLFECLNGRKNFRRVNPGDPEYEEVYEGGNDEDVEGEDEDGDIVMDDSGTDESIDDDDDDDDDDDE